MSDYKLCYCRNNILYFTDNFEEQWGDDWNDAPYEHNAGDPYEYIEGETDLNKHHGHIRYIAFLTDYTVYEPCELPCQPSYSVQQINKGMAPWLFSNTTGALNAGATIEEAKDWLKKTNLKYGELL